MPLLNLTFGVPITSNTLSLESPIFRERQFSIFVISSKSELEQEIVPKIDNTKIKDIKLFIMNNATLTDT